MKYRLLLGLVTIFTHGYIFYAFAYQINIKLTKLPARNKNLIYALSTGWFIVNHIKE